MYIYLICLFCTLCLLTAIACCVAAGRAEDAAVAWEREHLPGAQMQGQDAEEDPHAFRPNISDSG